jgi:hypothetical protein
MSEPILKLTLLMPSQCAGEWQPLLEKAIAIGFQPQENPQGVATVLHQLKRGRYRAYVLGASLDGVPEQAAIAVAICYRILDETTGTYSFFIWALLGIDAMGANDWQDALRLLREEARKLNCARIEAITDSVRVITLMKELGGDATKRLIRLEV